ncbi:MAG: hypothetical protein L0287_24690 [Anaerolineae bacterium]|nr:hypothetical protein [Anaerolineae bacterium]
MELARLYGWQPMGTQPPSGYDFHELCAEWDGTYLTNDGQMIKAKDALSLANALEKALDDIPDAKAEMAWNPKLWIEDDLPEWLSPEEKEMIEDGLEGELLDVMGMNPIEFFAGDEKYYLKQFIRFCRLGNFIVL